jgi:eukaryotic-like serine/threonine-protein kinase
MAAVYEARPIDGGATVALKILNAQAAHDEETVKRFDREAALAKSLDHPNLVQVLGHGTERGIHWMAMELVEGQTLESILDNRGAMEWREAVPIIVQVGRALEFMAERGVIHRDVKPANILLGSKGRVKLADLGFAKDLEPADSAAGLTMAGSSMGSPAYMAPEQVLDAKNVTFSADVYGLGASLYHALCGDTPFIGGNAYEVMERVLKHPPTSPLQLKADLPAGFAAFLDWSLGKSPDKRPADMTVFIRELEATAAAPDRASRIADLRDPGRKRRRMGIAVLVVVAVVVAVLLIGMLLSRA